MSPIGFQKKPSASGRQELSAWTQPTAFRNRIEEILRPIPRRVFIQQAGLTFLRDAWIASRVATALSSDSVRLIPDHRPDFELQRSGQPQQFEATEADRDGRRRGDEPDDPTPRDDPVEDWRKRFEAIPAALDRVITKKLSKDYPPGVSLVVYVNLGCYGAYVREGPPMLQRCTSPAKQKFKSVFAIWEGTLYRFWDSGRSSFARWPNAQADDF